MKFVRRGDHVQVTDASSFLCGAIGTVAMGVSARGSMRAVVDFAFPVEPRQLMLIRRAKPAKTKKRGGR
jgi:hypothetical protein